MWPRVASGSFFRLCFLIWVAFLVAARGPVVIHSAGAQTIFALNVKVRAAQSEASNSGVVRGRVFDARTGEPIARALVSLREQQREVLTDANGQFELTGVVAGELQLYVSSVGFGLVKRRVVYDGSAPLELEIVLGQEAFRRSEEITVTAGPFEPLEPAAVSTQALDHGELKNLGTVLVDDPLRAVHALPGVANSDDVRAQFSVRGSGFDKIGLFLDGVLTRSPFHTVRDVQDEGSLTVLNGDLVEAVSLIYSGAPARYGDRTGAVLNVQTRRGGHEKVFNRATVSASGLSFTSEGPLTRSRNASWLVSARRSYIQWLINKLSDDPELATVARPSGRLHEPGGSLRCR